MLDYFLSLLILGNHWKHMMKLVKLRNLVDKCKNQEKYSLEKFADFVYNCIMCGNCYYF